MTTTLTLSTLSTLTEAARRSTTTILAQSGEIPEDVDALLLMDDGLERRASDMVSAGWPRSLVRQAIDDGIETAESI